MNDPLSTRLTLKLWRSFVLMALVVGAFMPVRAYSAPADDVPADVQREIEKELQARASAIAAERNQEGKLYKRAFYSKLLHKISDTSYRVSFHVNTALADTEVVERFDVTVSRSGDAWKIAGEELKETYKGLHRGVLGDETCMGFESFNFDREGLSVKAGKGTLCKDFFMGKTSRIWLSADELSYSYTPPVPKFVTMHKVLKQEKASDLTFVPEQVSLFCDPISCEEFTKTAFTGLSDVGRDQVSPVVQKTLEEGIREAEKSLRENAFFAFRRPYEEERRSYAISIKRKGMEDHWLWLSYDNYEPKEVSVWASGFFAPLYSYHSEATRKSGVSPYDLELRPDTDARDFELRGLKGTVEMGFGDGETLVGDLTYTINTKRELRELPFSISRLRPADEKKEVKNPNMRINGLQDGNGNDLTWVRTGLYSGLVILPAPLPAKSTLTLRMQFENKDSLYKLTPAFSYVDRGGWLPLVRFADMIHEFDLTVKVPVRYKTLGIGRMVSETKEGGANITRWVADSPVSFPTVIFGQYYESASTFPAKKKDGTEIPVRIYFDKDFMGMYGITPKSLTKFANDAANSLNLYREIFGVDYPYSKLDLVNDPAPALYGQAPSSLIYLGSVSFFGKGLLESAIDSAEEVGKFIDSLVAHETAHQWWGSLVANSNFGNYWFVESLAEYSSALFTENVYGKKAYLKHVAEWRDEILKNDMRGSVQDGYTTWQGPGGFGPYRAALYAKGPYAFHIMRSTFGDEAFFKFLKNLAQELQGKEIVTRDIQNVAEKSFQMRMDWFFDQWLRGAGLPQFTFKYTTRKADDGSFLIEGEIEQKVLLKPATETKQVLDGVYFEGVVPVYVTTKSGKEMKKRVIVKGAKTTFTWSVPEQPKEVTLNKNLDSLAYDVVSPSSM